ncbi:MAG TPA: ABC transporter permease [Candidatus Luteococcus avicola]|nr:ABC transporter permease [Candidatus Luteococcus avicola]
MTVEPTWHLALALVLLMALAVVVSRVGRLGQERDIVVAGLRAVIQLAVVSTIIVAALQNLALAALFVALMFVVAVRTTVQRTGVGRAWPWTALAMATGIVPVLAIIFGSGTVPPNALSLIPIAGIVVGNMMTAHTLFGRRQFAALRDGVGIFEAALALGFARAAAIRLVSEGTAREALVPNLDQTRTVGLVTLPGAFIGVLLGGGSALQAGAAQVLVLVAIMAGQTIVVVVANWLMCQGKLLPPDLVDMLHP